MTEWSGRRWILHGALVVGLVIGVGLAASEAATPPYNIIIFKTDDHRWDMVERVIDGQRVMQQVFTRLVLNGVTFTNAFVSTPLCCPERASFLAGGYYAHETGVLTNDWPNGGAKRFVGVDRNALPPRLQRQGYATALIGKYLNGFKDLVDYVPPGWTRFLGTLDHGDWFRFTMLRGSTGPDAPGRGQLVDCEFNPCPYMTDYLRDEARVFLEQYRLTTPIFLVLSFHAPHKPANPAPGDEGLFPNYTYRERAWCEADLSDKPAWVRRRPRDYNCNDPALIADEDEFHRNQLRSLQAVDRAVADIVNVMQGARYPTVFILTSDNGYLWGGALAHAQG